MPPKKISKVVKVVPETVPETVLETVIKVVDPDVPKVVKTTKSKKKETERA